MKINCIVVEDDELSAKALVQCIKKTDFFNLTAVCSDAVEAEKVLRSTSVELIFLDIEMPVMNGIEFVQNMHIKPHIILTTSKPEYALAAFDLDVLDYMIKPISYARFLKAASKAREKTENRQIREGSPSSVFLKTGENHIRLNIEDISYAEKAGQMVRIVTTLYRSDIMADITMDQLENRLPPGKFARVNRDVIVNVDKISCVSPNSIIVKGDCINLSNTYKPRLKYILSI